VGQAVRLPVEGDLIQIPKTVMHPNPAQRRSIVTLCATGVGANERGVHAKKRLDTSNAYEAARLTNPAFTGWFSIMQEWVLPTFPVGLSLPHWICPG